MTRILLWSVGTSTYLWSWLYKNWILKGYLLSWGDNRFNSNDISNLHTLWHETLRHNKFKWHLTCIWNFNVSCRLNLFDFLIALHLNPNLRLLTTSHNIHDFLWISSSKDLFNFDDEIVLSRQIKITDIRAATFLLNSTLFIHNEFSYFV